MATIPVTEASNPMGIVELANSLANAKATLKAGDSVLIRFEHQFVYMSGLVMLAAWRKYLGRDVSVVIDDSQCTESGKRVLQRSGLKSIVEDNFETPSYTGNVPTRLPLQPIVPGFSMEDAISKACRMFDDCAGDFGEGQPFKTILSELVENALVHGQIETPGYISAALYQSTNGRKMEVCIVDTGIGVRSSYLEGSNDSVKARIKNGASPVEIAMDGLTSSKPQALTPSGKSHFGLGLFIVRRLVERNKGMLTVLSGNEAVTYDSHGKNRRTMQGEWHGTIVSMILDLSNPLSLQKVYEEATNMVVPAEVESGRRTVTVKENKPSHPDGARVTLTDFGKQLLSRDAGVTVRAEVAMMLANSQTVTVDLGGIEDITPSVADECFGKLAERLGLDVFRSRVRFEGGTPLIHRLLDFVLSQRGKGSDQRL